jgi:hypothetical protein
MVRLRRALGPLIGVWLVCQAGSAAATWLPAFDDCECPHGDGAVCPMHHSSSGTSQQKKTCSMRGVDASATVALASLLAPAGPAPAPAIVASTSIVSPTRSSDRSADSLRPVPPDPPPPRA